MIKTALKHLLQSGGYKIFANEQMPVGFNWLLDVERLARPAGIGTIFDVGANAGQTTVLLNARFPSAKIFSFEPLASTFSALEKNTAGLNNVTCINFALGRENSVLNLHPKTASTQNSLLPDFNQPNGVPAESIRVTTVDETLRANHIDHLNLLKTDTEGFDLEVIAGAKGALSRGAIDMLVVEVGFHPERRHHTYLPDVQAALLEHGYELYCIYDQNHYDGRIDYADALFVSPSIRKNCSRSYAETFVRHAE
ncbi:MAG TPA: FkbM family methyltransferase [Bradyrhizobium sp.]|nr:FkbM family methyltransferase [Bradyrhizobium sp.]